MQREYPEAITSFKQLYPGMTINVKGDYITSSVSEDVGQGKYVVAVVEPSDYDGSLTVILTPGADWVNFDDLCEEVTVWKV